MKKIGIIALVIGVLGVLVTLNMDTSVATGSGDRVNNIGLMNDQQNLLITFLAMAMAGLFFTVRNNTASDNSLGSLDAGKSTRLCPYCAEEVKANAIICRYCRGDIAPLPEFSQNEECAELGEKKEVLPEAYKRKIEGSNSEIGSDSSGGVLVFIIGIILLAGLIETFG